MASMNSRLYLNKQQSTPRKTTNTQNINKKTQRDSQDLNLIINLLHSYPRIPFSRKALFDFKRLKSTSNVNETTETVKLSSSAGCSGSSLSLRNPLSSFSSFLSSPFFPSSASSPYRPSPTLCLLSHLAAITSQPDHIPWPPKAACFSGGQQIVIIEKKKKASQPSLGGSTVDNLIV